MTDLRVIGTSGRALWQDKTLRCAIGRGGLVAAQTKIEGDGKTPIGRWPLQRVFYRADRVTVPVTTLPVQPLQPNDGWCDAPGDERYNQFVQHPYPASAEHLWREDAAYDLIVTLSYNVAPVVSGKGSAIFLHLVQPDFSPTAGCVAILPDDLLMFLAGVTLSSAVTVSTD
ncbi:MAG: L,D-transpeptidase family protein [Alphaproteobacteria bacterium]|nr:L,D-transpeptidase family protein [Alphaproteobacteria bacterium]